MKGLPNFTDLMIAWARRRLASAPQLVEFAAALGGIGAAEHRRLPLLRSPPIPALHAGRLAAGSSAFGRHCGRKAAASWDGPWEAGDEVEDAPPDHRPVRRILNGAGSQGRRVSQMRPRAEPGKLLTGTRSARLTRSRIACAIYVKVRCGFVFARALMKSTRLSSLAGKSASESRPRKSS
jgi:hypothetical protein